MSAGLSAAIAGVILAGGRGERMGGEDKGLLPLAGQPMVSYIIRVLRPQVRELIVNANRNLDIYRSLGCRVVSDEIKGFCGPLSGMLAAMNATQAAYILSAPCDSPLLPGDYAHRLMQALRRDEAEISVAHDGHRLQPVFALLKVELRDSLREYLVSGERKIDRWYFRQRMVIADFSDSSAMFRNINTPGELATLEREIAPGSVSDCK
jgi:molybdopterin-guanine dinucleotide biosynthesis protein A